MIMQNTVKDAFDIARSLGNLIELTDLGVQLLTAGFDRTSVAKKARMLMGRRALSKRNWALYGEILQTS